MTAAFDALPTSYQHIRPKRKISSHTGQMESLEGGSGHPVTQFTSFHRFSKARERSRAFKEIRWFLKQMNIMKKFSYSKYWKCSFRNGRGSGISSPQRHSYFPSWEFLSTEIFFWMEYLWCDWSARFPFTLPTVQCSGKISVQQALQGVKTENKWKSRRFPMIENRFWFPKRPTSFHCGRQLGPSMLPSLFPRSGLGVRVCGRGVPKWSVFTKLIVIIASALSGLFFVPSSFRRGSSLQNCISVPR
jgi:hypothetical protein